MSQSDLYDFFSYVARDGKGNAESPAAVMTRRTSVMSSSSSESSESGTPTPASTTSTTTRATATPAPPSLMPRSRTFSSSSPSTVATPQQQHRLTADEITARILESPEHHALCELLSGRHDHDDDYARRSSDKYRAFVDLAARLEAQKMPPPPRAAAAAAATARSGAFGMMQQHQQHQNQHEQSRREWNSLWW